MGRRLRAAVVGLGMMGRHHVRLLEAMNEVDLIGIVDPNGDPHGHSLRLATVGALDELPDLAALDLCVIATPTTTHRTLALDLAHRRVPALIEKPLAASLEECDEILEAFRLTNTLAAVGHIERFNPAMIALRARLEAEAIGPIVQIATRRQGPRPDRVQDVGVVRDLATHDFDLATWIGNADYDELHASVRSQRNSGHADLLVASGELTNGILVNHVVNWCSPVKERVTIVTGESGTLIADTLNADLIQHDVGAHEPEWDTVQQGRGVSEGDVTRVAIPKRESLRSELEAFCLQVRTGEQTEIASLAEGRRAVEVAEMCLLSNSRV